VVSEPSCLMEYQVSPRRTRRKLQPRFVKASKVSSDSDWPDFPMIRYTVLSSALRMLTTMVPDGIVASSRPRRSLKSGEKVPSGRGSSGPICANSSCRKVLLSRDHTGEGAMEQIGEMVQCVAAVGPAHTALVARGAGMHA